jgi:glycosyltransferase involved in cell wall biosynthesis
MTTLPLGVFPLLRRLRQMRPDIALCAMPGPLDLQMALALRLLQIPYVVTVHDANAHPGDALPGQMFLQRALLRGARAIITLSAHVEAGLRTQGWPRPGQAALRASLPPLSYGTPTALPGAHGGKLRLLSFGRLLPYKGLDLLAAALSRLDRSGMEIRVVGSGPESAALAQLRGLSCVTVENRWVPETEVAGLLDWADALVLSHTEASQSGVAAAALAARRWIVATRVGGMVEQLEGNPTARLCDATPDSLAAALQSLQTAPPKAGGDTEPDDRRAAAALTGALAGLLPGGA